MDDSLLSGSIYAEASHRTPMRSPWGSQTTMAAPCYPMAGLHRRSRTEPARPGALVDGRYRLLRRLGRGGVGEVWEAQHLGRGERVAIKLLLRELAQDAVGHQRFLREGRLAAALHHPHIVRVEEVGGAETSMPFLVMERLHGPSLEDVVMNEGALSWERTKQVLLQICDALEHAHRSRIVHHDVKPSNIVLASPPAEALRCKLVDFGIARQNLLQEPEITLTVEGQILGSPGYISPEQVRGKRANHRSDLYGLGATAYHLLTGRPPVEADSLPALVHGTLFMPPPPLGPTAGPWGRHREIEALIHRALSKDPADRFACARHMAQAIAKI